MSYRFVLPRQDVGKGITDFDRARLYFFDTGTTTPKTTYSDFALTIPNTDPVRADGSGIFGDIFLDTDADVRLNKGNDPAPGTLVWGPITIYPPDDSIAALAASVVTVLDTGGNYTAVNVETVLAEIADDWSKKSRAETISGTKTYSSANINLADNLLIRSEIKDFSLTHNVISSVSGVLTVNLEDGNSFITTLTENITTFTITNPPATGKEGAFTLRVIQDGAGGAYTMAAPTGGVFPGGTAWVVSTGNDARDKGTYTTIDAGTLWEIDFSQAYA